MEDLAIVAALGVFLATIFGFIFTIYFVKLARRLASLAQVLKREAELRISANYELPPPMRPQQGQFLEGAGEDREKSSIGRPGDQKSPRASSTGRRVNGLRGFSLTRERWEKVYWSIVTAWFVLRLFTLGLNNLADPEKFGYVVGQTAVGGLALWWAIKIVVRAVRAFVSGLHGV